MNYLLLTAIIPLAVGLFYIYRRIIYSNFDHYADLTVSVLLDQNIGDFTSHYGCIIFQLPSYGEHVKEVVITGVHVSNKHIRVNAFEKLNFFLTPGKSSESAMRSIGFSISNRGLVNLKDQKESIVVKGYVIDRKGEKKSFLKTSYYILQDFSREIIGEKYYKLKQAGL
ncbi:hypothetical protein [Sphingobacterium humi]|uniref:Uncharacterized protein n=1 Tax=Sphingobacterium humi TaxID=1796905 RepID=A0A6N8L7C7_9SPHI|nr:hypothetical protein [Sphingobacterium humi]MVZ63632.1 hypothetical protein [Sphingobacterium humi]